MAKKAEFRIFSDPLDPTKKRKVGRPRYRPEITSEEVPLPDPSTIEDDWSAVVDDGKKKPAHQKYPPPSKHPVFVARWNIFIADIAERDNFKESHLPNLKVLCDLYVTYENMNKTLTERGYVYENDGGRSGPQLKVRPETKLITQIVAEIRGYTKTLGLLLHKDKNFTDEDEKKNEWS